MNLRPFAAGDEAAAAGCWRSVDDPNALGVEAFREQANRATSMLVAEEERTIMGFARLCDAWWYGPEMYSITLVVRRDRWGRGIGGRLWSAIGERIPGGAEGKSKVFTHISEDLGRAKSFASARGLEPTGSVVLTSQLEVGAAKLEELESAEARLKGDGVAVVRLQETHLLDQEFLSTLYDCVQETEVTSPASQEVQARPYDEWLRPLREGLHSQNEVMWAAVEAERVIGMASLEVLDDERLENGFTGVRVKDRGRGVAKALKAHTIRWAGEAGYRLIVTGSEVGNDPMLRINERIGYRRLPAMEEWARTVPVRG